MKERNKLAEAIHTTAVNKGWWEGDRNLTEARMLIITELAEAVEADREGRRADYDSFQMFMPKELSAAGRKNYEESKPFTITQYDKTVYKKHFKKYIKDTVEDELADTYIRILDLLYHESDGDLSSYMGDRVHLDTELVDNFAASIYQICNMVDRSLSFTLYLIEELCNMHDIDLGRYVNLKMEFNKLRRNKHGGKKY